MSDYEIIRKNIYIGVKSCLGFLVIFILCLLGFGLLLDYLIGDDMKMPREHCHNYCQRKKYYKKCLRVCIRSLVSDELIHLDEYDYDEDL